MRRTAIALSAVALTATLGACSQGPDTEQPEQNTGNEQHDQEQAAGTPFSEATSLASHVDGSMEKQQSVRMSLEVRSGENKMPAMDCEVDIAASAMSCTDGQMELVLTPDATYTKVPGLAATPDKPWTKVGNSGGGPLSAPSSGFQMATDFEKMLPPGSTITNSAPEQLNGEETTRYDVTTDINQAMAEADENQRQLYQPLIDAGVTETTGTTWIGADGLPAKLESVTPEMTVMGREVPANTVTITYEEWGVPVDVQPPPADQVQER